MTEQELDHIMRRVLIDSLKMDAEKIEEGQRLSFKPTSRYKRRMRTMLADPLRWLRRQVQPRWQQIALQVAIIWLTCIVVFGGVMAFSPKARAVVIRWFMEWYENRIVYRYTGEQNSEPLPQYEITELPDGYVETERYAFPAFVAVTYEDQNGNAIYFDYVFMYEGAQTNFVLNDDVVFDVMVNQMNGQFIESRIPGNLNSLAWIDTGQNIQFTIDGCFEYDELLHIAESISLCKTTN